jgi:hypothetical protein
MDIIPGVTLPSVMAAEGKYMGKIAEVIVNE